MERLTYSEAREWFWIRTAIWFVPAGLASATAHFAYASDLFELLNHRVTWSVCGGVGSVAVAVLSAYLTQQTPWMRMGMRISYLINGPACALISGLIGVLVCGMVLTFVQGNPPNAIEEEAAYEAFLVAVDRSYQMMVFVCGAAVFWGFIFGSWFAMRRDKYFIDPIMG